MRAFAHIHVVQWHGQYWASFKGTPEVGYGGLAAEHAVRRLVEAIGGDDLDLENIIEIESARRDGHSEFLVPYLSRRRHPVAVSVN